MPMLPVVSMRIFSDEFTDNVKGSAVPVPVFAELIVAMVLVMPR